MADKRKSRSDKKNAQTNPITRYLRETRGELKKVTWPTRDESQRLTAIVLGVTIAMAGFFWVFDLLFSTVIENLTRLLAGV